MYLHSDPEFTRRRCDWPQGPGGGVHTQLGPHVEIRSRTAASLLRERCLLVLAERGAVASPCRSSEVVYCRKRLVGWHTGGPGALPNTVVCFPPGMGRAIH